MSDNNSYPTSTYGQNVRPDSKTLPRRESAFDNLKNGTSDLFRQAGEVISEKVSKASLEEIEESTEKMVEAYKNNYDSICEQIRNEEDDARGDGDDDDQPEKELKYKKKEQEGPEL